MKSITVTLDPHQQVLLSALLHVATSFITDVAGEGELDEQDAKTIQFLIDKPVAVAKLTAHIFRENLIEDGILDSNGDPTPRADDMFNGVLS